MNPVRYHYYKSSSNNSIFCSENKLLNYYFFFSQLILVTFLALGATANSYGSSNSYGGSSSYGSSSSSNSYGGGYGKSGEGNAAITSFNRQIQGSNSDTTSFTTSNGISQSHNVRVVKGNAYRDTYGNTYGGGDTIAMNGHSYHTSPEGMHVRSHSISNCKYFYD